MLPVVGAQNDATIEVDVGEKSSGGIWELNAVRRVTSGIAIPVSTQVSLIHDIVNGALCVTVFEFPAWEVRSAGSLTIVVFCGVGSSGRGERFDGEKSSRNSLIADDATPGNEALFSVSAADALSADASTLTSF